MFGVVILRQTLVLKSFYIITVNCLVNIYLCEFPTLDCDALKLSCACLLSPFIIVLCNGASRQDIYYNNISKFLTLNSCLYWAHWRYFESSVFPNIWRSEEVEQCWYDSPYYLYLSSVSSLQRLQIRKPQQNYSWRLWVKLWSSKYCQHVDILHCRAG